MNQGTGMGEVLAFLDSLCSAYLSIRQAESPEHFEGRGVVIPEAQVLAALSGQHTLTPWPGFDSCFDALYADLPAPFDELIRRLDASPFEALVLLLAYAPEQNRKYERVFGYLQDNIAEKYATLGLAADLYHLIRPIDEGAVFALCDTAHPLNRYVLTADMVGLSRRLCLRETALLYLSGAGHLTEEIRGVGERLDTQIQRVVTGEEGLQRGMQFMRAVLEDESGRTGLLALYGADGMGRRFCLRYAATQLGREILALDCDKLAELSREVRDSVVDTVIAHCWLRGTIPLLLHWDGAGEKVRIALAQTLLDHFAGRLPFLAISAERPLKLHYDVRYRVFAWEASPYSIAEQRLFWQSFAEKSSLPLEDGLAPLRLANTYTLTPGQIERVLQSAETYSLANGEHSITWAGVSDAVRQLCRPRLSALAEPMRVCFSWEDLMLEDRARMLLERLCDRIRYRWQVNEAWGFNRKLPYGKGVSVLLYGPPGTGKTMTAQVLAGEFGLDAYRVDLSRIMDKYIGETEKKLGELFDAAKDSNAILFFDEADALFTKRTEVSDSKDKYANAETAYLLQRMEQHNGVSILATNAAQNFDEAFKRRISFMIPVGMPSPALRKKLWQSVFPPEAPLERVDWDFFAERFELSGSSIKNVAVAAAFRAAAEGTTITRDLLSDAVREEYQKNGRVLMEHQLY